MYEIYDELPFGVIIFSGLDLSIQYINSAFLKIFEFQDEELEKSMENNSSFNRRKNILKGCFENKVSKKLRKVNIVPGKYLDFFINAKEETLEIYTYDVTDYINEENKIKARIRDWVVEAPTNGFVFPAFIDRSADINSIMYYTKNAKNTHPELMQNVLGCYPKQTATIQKETFQSIIKDSFSADEKKADKIFMKVQENLNTMVEEYTATYEDTYCEPITLTKDHIQNLLIESGVPEEITAKIENSYVENFGDDLPLAENLIDSKALKANEQLKKEENLQKQIEILETKLQQVKQENDEVSSEYDIVLKVKPEKIPEIKSQIIDGKKCIIIPVDENEQATINGLDDIV